MKIQWKKLLVCLAIPLGVGTLAALLTREGVRNFAALPQPSLMPPAWLFPLVWTVLYALMGVASYKIATAEAPADKKRKALTLYGIQLAVNFIWPFLFFTGQLYFFSLVWILLLWVLVLFTTLQFFRIDPTAGWLMVPYLAWVTFAVLLNGQVFFMSAL